MSHLTLLNLLAEVLHRDIGQHIACEVGKDGVDTLQRIEGSRQVVVVLNLCSVLCAYQAE